MHALTIVQQLIQSCCPGIHAARLTAILAAVAAAVRSRRLTLTELGRALVGAARVKHSIKRIDRLLGNRHLAAERFPVSSLGAARGCVPRLIVVDWTDLTPDRRWQLPRASFPPADRLTIYEEVHPCVALPTRVHRAFLVKLKTLLPETVKPILITDAGFRALVQAVNRMGWHWIGRIRNRLPAPAGRASVGRL